MTEREVAEVVGIASAFAGPSEIVVVADHSAPPSFAAVDVVVQAEHGPDGLAWLVCWDDTVADAVSAEVARITTESPRRAEIESTLAVAGYAVVCRDEAQAMEVANAIAPEHLQLMTSGKKVESRQQEVSEFSRQIKLLAKELEVPVVAMSQLNRGPEQRTDKKPMLADLRESGSIEQDADVVMFVYREEYYLDRAEPSQRPEAHPRVVEPRAATAAAPVTAASHPPWRAFTVARSAA